MSGRPPNLRTYSSPADHRPAQPSTLRNTHRVPGGDDGGSSGSTTPSRGGDRSRASGQPPRSGPTASSPRGGVFASELTPLISDPSDRDRRSTSHPAHGGECTHGTFSPRPSSPVDASGRRSYDAEDDASSSSASGTKIPVLDDAITHLVGHEDWKRWLKRRVTTKKMGRSSELAEQAGIRDTSLM